MNNDEFNKTVIEQSYDCKNKQPDEFEQTVENGVVKESKKVRFNFKDNIKNTASEFLLLVVGASLTIAGLETLPNQKNSASVDINQVTDSEITFSFSANFNDISARVYNDFEKLPCKLEFEKIDDDTYKGFGICDSLRPNTSYTVSIDGKEMLGNASRAKKKFTTKERNSDPVITKYLESISINGEPTKIDYIEGEIFEPAGLSILAYFSNDEIIDVTDDVIWGLNPLVANQEYVSVTYNYEGVEKKENFTNFFVKPQVIRVSSVVLNQKEITLQKGEETYLEYSVLPENATDKKVTFASSNIDCATVDENGLIKALKEGETIITVKTTDGGFESYLKLVVEYKWQEDVNVETSLDRISENIIIYKIKFGDEITNISRVNFRYYTFDEEPQFLIEIPQDVRNYNPITKEATFLVEIGNLIGLKQFQDVLYVIRNGEEESLCYSSSYDLNEVINSF